MRKELRDPPSRLTASVHVEEGTLANGSSEILELVI